MPTRHLGAVLLVGVLYGNAACAQAPLVTLSVEQIIQRYLQSVDIKRFSGPYHMRYRREYKIPPEVQPPEAYVEWIEYSHWAAPPNFRTEGKIGPMVPHGTVPETHTHVFNGDSSANLYSMARNNSLTVERGSAGPGLAMVNLMLSEMGFPQLPDEREEAQDREYWIPQAVTESSGYRLEPKTQKVAGVECHVIRRDDIDVMWFDCRAGARLVQRDVWRTTPFIRRKIIRLYDYQENGLPRRIVTDIYGATNEIGTPSDLAEREELKLLHVDFNVPDSSRFVLDIKPETRVLDINTLLNYEVQKPGRPPFEELIRSDASRPRRTSPLIWATLFVGGIGLLLIGLWLRRAVTTLDSSR